MAEVFAARLRGPRGFQKLVAVKRLLPALLDAQFISMFLDEARVAASISSPHVVQTIELGRDEIDNALYIVMELVVGVTLFDLCVNVLRNHKSTPLCEMTEILAQAARGLDDAHEARSANGTKLNVVHRDVSPQNILVGIDGRVRVTDFGIARATGRRAETQAGQVKGKVAYLSPEQLAGKVVDRRSDVFSLGVVAWECLTGCSLFNTGDALETISRVRELEIPKVTALRHDVPAPLAEAIAWALERDPSKRCPSAAEFAAALKKTGLCSRTREVGILVEECGGSGLATMQDRIRNVSEHSVVFRPEFDGEDSRIFPEAAPQEKLLPSQPPPPAAPVASFSQRAFATTPVKSERVELSHEVLGRASPPTSALWIAGALAWLLAAALLWWGYSLERRPSNEPVLRAPLAREPAAPTSP